MAYDASGALRVEGSRIPLDNIVYAFQDGASPEEICGHYPSLPLSSIYAAITYYCGTVTKSKAICAAAKRPPTKSGNGSNRGRPIAVSAKSSGRGSASELVRPSTHHSGLTGIHRDLGRLGGSRLCTSFRRRRIPAPIE